MTYYWLKSLVWSVIAGGGEGQKSVSPDEFLHDNVVRGLFWLGSSKHFHRPSVRANQFPLAYSGSETDIIVWARDSLYPLDTK